MKNLLFVIFFCIITGLSFGQIVFEETFEIGNVNGVKPNGWACGEVPKWLAGVGEQDHDRFAHNGNWYVYFPWNSNSWMYKEVQLTANKTYEFSMWYKTDGRTGFQYEVKWGVDTFEANMNSTIQPLTDISNSVYQQLISTFTPVISGNYYIGIHGVSNNNPWYLVLDDIKLQIVDAYNFELNKISGDTIIYAGNYYDYKVKIKNTGINTDVYNLSYSSDWNVEFYDGTSTNSITSITLNSYVTDSFVVRQYVPASNVTIGQSKVTDVTVSSENSSQTQALQFTSIAVSPIVTYPYLQDFDDISKLPIGWNARKITGNYNFVMTELGNYPTCTPHDNSAGMIFYQSFSASAGSSAILSSPPLSFSAGEYVVRFWVYRTSDIDNKADKFEIYLSDNETLNNQQLLGTIHRAINFEPVEATNGWFEYYFVFTVPEAVKFIIFKAVSEYGWNMYIDDVKINLNTPDVTAPEFISIGKTTQYADLSMPITVKIRDESQVTSTMQGIYNVGDGNENFILNLTTNSKGDYVYTGEIPAQIDNTSGTVKFIMVDILGNEAESDEFPILWQGIAPLLEESFENTFPPTGWSIISQPLTWFIWQQVGTESYEDSDGNTFTVVPVHGVKQAMIGWDFQENQQDEWLISPEIEITALANLTFETFAQCGSMYYDQYVVGVSTNGFNWDGLWNASDLNTYINQYNDKINIPLDNYLGQTIRISWRAYNTVWDNIWYSWFIDDVKVEKRQTSQIQSNTENQELDFVVLQNPVNKILSLNIKNNRAGNLEAKIFDINGVIQLTKSINKTDYSNITFSLNIDNLNSGVYLCKISGGKNMVTKRFVIVK